MSQSPWKLSCVRRLIISVRCHCGRGDRMEATAFVATADAEDWTSTCPLAVLPPCMFLSAACLGPPSLFSKEFCEVLSPQILVVSELLSRTNVHAKWLHFSLQTFMEQLVGLLLLEVESPCVSLRSLKDFCWTRVRSLGNLAPLCTLVFVAVSGYITRSILSKMFDGNECFLPWLREFWAD